MPDADRYRLVASSLREAAETHQSPCRGTVLSLAAHFERLAHEAEEEQARDQKGLFDSSRFPVKN